MITWPVNKQFIKCDNQRWQLHVLTTTTAIIECQSQEFSPKWPPQLETVKSDRTEQQTAMEFEASAGSCSRSQTVPDLAAIAPIPPSPCLSLNPPSPLSTSRSPSSPISFLHCHCVCLPCRPLSPDSCTGSIQNGKERLASDSPLVFQGRQHGGVDEAWANRAAMISLEASKQMALLKLEESSTPRSAAHMAMLNLEDSSLECRVSSLEERCKVQEEEVAELKAGLANALNRIATLEGEKKHSFQVFILSLFSHLRLQPPATTNSSGIHSCQNLLWPSCFFSSLITSPNVAFSLANWNYSGCKCQF